MNKKFVSNIFIISLFGIIIFYLLGVFNLQCAFGNIATQSIYSVGMWVCGVILVLSTGYLIVSNYSKFDNFSKGKRDCASNVKSTVANVQKRRNYRRIERIGEMKKKAVKKTKKKAAPKTKKTKKKVATKSKKKTSKKKSAKK